MFKLKIRPTDKRKTYAEMDQPNPMRWRIMHKTKDVLTSQTGILKCKDFFNDLVAYRHGIRIKIYRFDNKIKFNRVGLYIHVTNIANIQQFRQNLAIVNGKLVQHLGKMIVVEECTEDSLILMLPLVLFKRTYDISLATLLIRLCNYNVKYTSWDSIFLDIAPIYSIESGIKDTAKQFIQENGWILPPDVADLWYNAGYGYNSALVPEPSALTVHDNGVGGWVGVILNEVDDFDEEEEEEEDDEEFV